MTQLFSNRDRPVNLGPFPLEALARSTAAPDLSGLPVPEPLSLDAPDPLSLSHAMRRFMAMLDTLRDGPIAHAPAEIPEDPAERARHL